MTKTEKYRSMTDDCLARMSDEERAIYRPILDCALELGYVPKPVVKSDGDDGELSFSKSRFNRTLLRILPMNEKTFPKYPLIKAGHATMRLVFFATKEYSEPFSMGIKAVIEGFDGRYTGCYGCGRCKNGIQGYRYVYPDGKKIFRCGRELILLPPLGKENVDEAIDMIKAQDALWSAEVNA